MDSFQKKARAELVKNLARKAGFDDCGISESGFLAEEAPRLEEWLKKGQHGEMSWMENWFDKRLDTRKLVEGSKSVITVILNYFPEEEQNPKSYKISKYAYGKDYHFVVKEKLQTFYYSIKKEIGEINGRMFVDSAPVMDRAWAKKSGLGWIGKHTLMITKSSGSYFFIGHIISDLELQSDNEIPDYCGDCTRCIDACPTDAISSPYWLDASKCISYLTIELKSEIPDAFQGKMKDWIFGCDICQDVCPWNRFSKKHNVEEFKPLNALLGMNKSDWENLDASQFAELFPKSAVKRTKFKGLKRNIDFVTIPSLQDETE